MAGILRIDMYRWKQYLITQLKRVGKVLPGICLLTVVLTVSLLFLLKAIFLMQESKEENRAVKVGICGDLSDTYLGIGINVLKNMEGVKNLADIQSMTEEEAKEKFADGQISAYLVVPDGFIDSIITGENKELTYVTTESSRDIGGLLINELVDSISGMITMTQSSVQAMQLYMMEHDKKEQLREATEGINQAYIEVVLDRMEVFELQELGVSNRISFTGHLFTGVLLLLMLLWGINCVSLLVRNESSLLKILHTKGLKGKYQVTAEMIAYVCLQGASLLCVFCCLIVVKSLFGFSIREWDVLDTGEQLLFLGSLLPVVVLVSVIQAFLYEMVTNVVTGVLVQFVAALSMAYMSGCIYPISFFPEGIQALGTYSPVGMALQYMQKGLTGQTYVKEFLVVVLYIILFLGLHMWRRNYRIAKE